VFDIGPGDRQLSSSNEDDGSFRSSIRNKKIVGRFKLGRTGRRARVCGRRDPFLSHRKRQGLVHVIDVASGRDQVKLPVGSRPRRFAQTGRQGSLGVGRGRWLGVCARWITYALPAASNSSRKGFPAATISGPVGLTLSKDGAQFHRACAANRVAVVYAMTKGTRLHPAGQKAVGRGAQRDDAACSSPMRNR